MPPPTDVKFFRFDQPDAPQITNTAGALIGVLDACLVDGWGLVTLDSLSVDVDGIATATRATGHSQILHGVVEIDGATPAGLNGQHKIVEISSTTFKFEVDPSLAGTATGTITAKVAPAGWEKVFSGSDKAVYRSLDVESTKCLLRVDASNAGYAQIRGYTAMTDVDTGVGPFPDTGQAANFCWFTFYSSTGTKNWFLVADSRTFFLGVAYYVSTGMYGVGGFGDFVPRKPGDSYACFIRAHSNTTSTSTYSEGVSIFAPNAASQYVARDVSGVGGAVQYDYLTWPASTSGSGHMTSGANDGAPYPNPADGALLLAFSEVQERLSKVFRGRVPGVLYSPQVLRDRVSGGATAWTTVTSLDLPGRAILAVPYMLMSSSTFYVGFIDLTGPWR